MTWKYVIWRAAPLFLAIMLVSYFAGDGWRAIPSALVAWGTILLAFATFTLIRHSREQEEQRRKDDQAREKRDRKEKVLNEIIGWAIDVARCGSTQEIPIILEDIQMHPKGRFEIQQKVWRSTFGNLLFKYQAIDARSDYIKNVASIFGSEVADTLAEVIGKLDNVIYFLPEHIKHPLGNASSDKLSDLEHSLQESATTLIRVATNVKVKDIVES